MSRLDGFAYVCAAALSVMLVFAVCTVSPVSAADDEADMRLAWAVQSARNGTATTEVEFVKHVIRTQAISAGASPAEALSVAWCESKYDPKAVNGQYQGLFQIGNYHRDRAARLGYSWADMLRPLPNARVAMSLWADAGWVPWSCRP